MSDSIEPFKQIQSNNKYLQAIVTEDQHQSWIFSSCDKDLKDNGHRI